MKESQPPSDSADNSKFTIGSKRQEELRRAHDMSSEEFIEAFSGGLAETLEKIKSDHPLHPVTGEQGDFLRFDRQYAVYVTPTGGEFILPNKRSPR
jgi:hypothetical protein